MRNREREWGAGEGGRGGVWSEYMQELDIGTQVDTLPEAECCRASVGNGWPDVSLL